MGVLQLALDNIGVTVLSITVVVLVVLKLSNMTARKPYPPGPKPTLLVGNLLDVPANAPWRRFAEYTREYGGVVWLDLPMQPTIVVGTAQAALDLMEKRSQIYSCRQETVMDKLMCWDWNFAFVRYGAQWRALRKCFRQHLHQGVIHKFEPIQTRETRAFMRRMLTGPQDIEEQTSHTFAAIILDVIYGTKINGMQDDYVQAATTANEGLVIAKVPGAFWVEFMPFLKYLPRWMPGTMFHTVADYYKSYSVRMRDEPFEIAKKDLAEGKADPSVSAMLLKAAQEHDDPLKAKEAEMLARDSMGVAYSAGLDTTKLASQGFILAMAMYPDVQKKAQAELESVIGSGRLPEMSDRDSLVYIQAIVMESLRWIPVLPLGIPHRLIEDDTYNGYFIPKGTVVIPNQYGMLHNEDDYPEPHEFRPERFIKDGKINPEVRDPSTIAFGFGRRICPGQFFSSRSLFIFIASVLHGFTLEAAKDQDGRPVPLSGNMVGGFLTGPESVPVVMKPRSDEMEKLIKESALEHW